MLARCVSRVAFHSHGSTGDDHAFVAFAAASSMNVMDAAWSTFQIQSGRVDGSRLVFDAPTLAFGLLCLVLMMKPVWNALGGTTTKAAYVDESSLRREPTSTTNGRAERA